MNRIVVETSTGFANFAGDRLSFDPEREMFFCYASKELVGAFDLKCVMKIYISQKGESQ